MSKAEILAELPKLAVEERREIWTQLDAMDGFSDEYSSLVDDDADDELTSEQRAMLEKRIADFEHNPHSVLTLEEFNAWIDGEQAK